jgi:hypothetical protein
LADALDLAGGPAHEPDDVPWSNLPPRHLVQMHWRRTPALMELLDRHQFQQVSIHRHPLGTLISILHVSLYDVQANRWLSGEQGDESPIVAAMPRSQAFLEYAAGRRARAFVGHQLFCGGVSCFVSALATGGGHASIAVISARGSRTVSTCECPLCSIFRSMFRNGMSSMTGIPYSTRFSSMALLSTNSPSVTPAIVPVYTWEALGFD